MILGIFHQKFFKRTISIIFHLERPVFSEISNVFFPKKDSKPVKGEIDYAHFFAKANPILANDSFCLFFSEFLNFMLNNMKGRNWVELILSCMSLINFVHREQKKINQEKKIPFHLEKLSYDDEYKKFLVMLRKRVAIGKLQLEKFYFESRSVLTYGTARA